MYFRTNGNWVKPNINNKVFVKACGRAVGHRSSTAMSKHAIKWLSTGQAQPHELLSVMNGTEDAQ